MDHPTRNVVKKENNRIFNLIWIAAFGVVLSAFILHPVADMLVVLNGGLFLVISILEILLILIPKRNNFFSAFFLLPIAVLINNAGPRFYHLTWLFYPDLYGIIAEYPGLLENPPELGKWFPAAGWAFSFLTVLTFLYMFLSSIVRLITHHSHCFLCLLISLVTVSTCSYLGFLYLPYPIILPQSNITKKIEENISIRFLDERTQSKGLSSAQTGVGFSVLAENLSRNQRYGLRILDQNGTALESTSKFQRCNNEECTLNLGIYNGGRTPLDPGDYTF